MPFTAPSEELTQAQGGFTAPDDDLQQPSQPRFNIRPTQDQLRAQLVAARNVQPATTIGELPKVFFTPSDETRARATEQVRTHMLEPVDALGADVGPIIKPTTPEDISTLTGLNPSSRAAKVASAVVTTPGQVANSFATPEGALMFASPAAGAAFVAQMAASVPQKLGAAAGAYSAGDKDTGDANLVEGLATAGMLALPAIYAFKAGKPLDEIIGPDKSNQLRQQVISNPTVKESLQVQNPNEEVISPSNPPPLDTAATPPEAATAAEPNAAAPDSTEPLKVQPALKIDGKVYTGGDTHYDIKKSLSQDVQDEYTMAPDVDAQHIFLDQDGNELSRTDLQKAIGVSNSEDIPAANKIPKPLNPDEISAQTGANYDGEIKNSAGESVKGFTFKNPTHPLKGVTFNLKGDVTPDIVSAKLKELNDRFSGDAEHTIQEGEGGKFNIVNPSGKTLETFPNRAEAEKVLPEYNTPGIPSEVDAITNKKTAPEVGKQVPSTRGEDVLKAAVEKGLIEKTGDLPTHEGLNIKREASKAVDFINKNPDEALKISKGEENNSGVRPEAVYTALEEKAIQGGDVATLRELANSSLPTEAGQRLKLLDSNSPFSPVKIMRDIRNAREAASERRTKTTKEKVVKEIKQSITRNRSRLDSWEDVVRKLACN